MRQNYSMVKNSNVLLEPCEGKLSCTVLRGESPSNGADLLDNPNYCSVNGALLNKDKTVLIQVGGGRQGVFDIPNSVTEIGSYAFSECSGLTSVTIPNSVTEIGGHAFSFCSGLTSVTIPNSVTKISSSVFSGCSGLTSVTIPNSVTEIGGHAFSFCSGLTSVTIPNSVTKISSSVFSGCSELASVTIPNSVTEIGEYAFYHCYGLTSVTIPNSVTEIGYGAFKDCASLSEINVDPDNPNYCSVNGALLNKDKTVLIQVGGGRQGVFDIPNSVTEIGDEAFYGCSELASVTIPNSVTEIGEYAFWACYGLKEVYCSATTPPITGGETFSGNTLDGTLYVPLGTKSAYMAVSPWRDFWNIEEYDFSSSGVEHISGDINSATVITGKGNIRVLNKDATSIVRVYSINGNLIAETSEDTVHDLSKGTYIVTVGTKSFKVMI